MGHNSAWGAFGFAKMLDADGEEESLLSPSLSTPTTHSQPVPHCCGGRWVGAEESSVKDGEIFNDLSELTRFEAKHGKEREGGREARIRKTSSS